MAYALFNYVKEIELQLGYSGILLRCISELRLLAVKQSRSYTFHGVIGEL
ncbi:MAG: hypothetical protein ACI4DP_12955 [Candidatus Ornithomonoglobus sp.]